MAPRIVAVTMTYLSMLSKIGHGMHDVVGQHTCISSSHPPQRCGAECRDQTQETPHNTTRDTRDGRNAH